MYVAQCLEKGLVHLAFSYLLSDREILTKDQWDKLFAEVNKKTFGRLLKVVSKTLSAPQSVFNELEVALEKRNWLAHDYFFENAGKFATEKGRKEMLSELSNLIDFFSKVDQFIDGVCRHIWLQHGVTEEMVQKEISRMKREHA